MSIVVVAIEVACLLLHVLTKAERTHIAAWGAEPSLPAVRETVR